MSDLKHVGRVRSTGKRCMVAYRTLPGDSSNALVILTESLPDSYHDSLVNLVESNAGQAAYEFAEVLARTNFPDGTIMLHSLHTQGKLVRVGTSDIDMIPKPGVSIQLSELNQIIAQQRGITVGDLAIKSKESAENIQKSIEEGVDPSQVKSVEELTDVKVTTESTSEVTEPDLSDPETAIKFYRAESDRLAKQAAQYRRMAAELSNPTSVSESVDNQITDAVTSAVVEPVVEPKPAKTTSTKPKVSVAKKETVKKPAVKKTSK